MLKGPWRPFPVALLIYFCLDQMASGSCDCTGVLLITLFISPTAQFKGQISCNTFARKINHSRSLLFGHHASDICSVPHYTLKLLDLIHVFINSITKAGRVLLVCLPILQNVQPMEWQEPQDFTGRRGLRSLQAPSWRPSSSLWRQP